MKRYNPSDIEPKWQQVWQETNIYQAKEEPGKPHDYILDFFPYPSGAAMHVGHVRNYTISDTLSRFARMQGKAVLHPMGWDAFGLPAENYAIKTGISPKQAVAQNTERFKKQLMQMGMGIDWSREFSSTDPSYYRWTQWFFKLLFDRGLAYQKENLQWWCDTDKTVLANEQVEAGRCWRCGNMVTKKPLKQWFFKITDYADRLAADLDKLDWSDAIKAMQRNWIGCSQGAEVDFAVDGRKETVKIFTTRPDTLFGATFMVLAPEHPLAETLATEEQRQAVQDYMAEVKQKSDIDRMDTEREKTGVFTGAYAINPVNGAKIPIWVADYVLMGYGTGAIMAVPAHDDRDYAFALKFRLDIVAVIEPETGEPQENPEFRRSIVAVVRNPRTGKYLSINWGTKLGGHLFVGGGLEAGEEAVAAALREIREETGYKHLELVNMHPQPIHHHYFAHSKGVARQIEAHALLFELTDDERDEPKLEADEKGKFTVDWLNEKEIETKVLDALHATSYQLLVKSGCYSGEGIMINSGPYDGQRSAEVREAIVRDLEKKGAAKLRVNYRIRDWLISRQRYWGAPIPIVHCRECAKKQLKPVTDINFYLQIIWDNIAAGRKTVESRALNPEEPERYFGDIKVGDVLRFVNKAGKDEPMLVTVDEVRTYATLRDFYNDRSFALAVMAGQDTTWEEFQSRFAALTPDYLDKIAKNGIVAWRVSPATVPVPVPEDQLPIELPDVTDYQPSGDGRSPLARAADWVNTTCPTCGGPALRETDTMDGFACSSWYFLRFADPHNDKKPFDLDKVKYWLPVDTYVGGAEHAVMHLLYARFWTKVMCDAGLIDFDEPFTALRNQGMILAPDGRKMSKSWGNVIAPDDLIAEGYGADSIRLMELFIGPWNQSANWSTEGLGGCYRFLQRIWTLAQDYLEHDEPRDDSEQAVRLQRATHKTIKKVTTDLREMGFNTAIAALMEYVNELYKIRVDFAPTRSSDMWRQAMTSLTQLLAPFAPHLSEELWHELGNSDTVHLSAWPTWDESYLSEATLSIVVQVNGKVRTTLLLPNESDEAAVTAAALQDERIKLFMAGQKPKRIVYVPGKLINIVI